MKRLANNGSRDRPKAPGISCSSFHRERNIVVYKPFCRRRRLIIRHLEIGPGRFSHAANDRSPVRLLRNVFFDLQPTRDKRFPGGAIEFLFGIILSTPPRKTCFCRGKMTRFSYHLLWYFRTKEAYDHFEFRNLAFVDFRKLNVPVKFDSQL